MNEGLDFGYSVFETICFRQHRGYEFLERHLKRLRSSCEILEIHCPSTEELITALNHFGNDLPDRSGVKVLISKEGNGSTVKLSTRPNPYPSTLMDPIKLTFASAIRDEQNILSYHKTSNYLVNLLESKKVRSKGFDDALFLNRKNHLTETTKANLFLFDGSKIYTPKLDCGVLNGIIRQVILERLFVNEVEVRVEDLSSFKGVALTNSLMPVIPVGSINDTPFDDSTAFAEHLLFQLQKDIEIEKVLK